MLSFDDIPFDTNYSEATCRFLVLNHQHGPSPVISLPHAVLMTFIRVFYDLIQCQQYISNENRKIITLAISNEQIIDWNNQINIIDHNIDKVYVICYTYFDYLKMKRWQGCYRTKIKDVYLPDNIDYHLIKLGIDHIHSILPEFRQERGVHRKLCTDAQRLTTVLYNYFQDQMDSVDDSPSEENQ